MYMSSRFTCEKLTLTCEMLIWKDWIIKKTKVYESFGVSGFKLHKLLDNFLGSIGITLSAK